MILTVFSHIGDTLSITEAYSRLISIYKGLGKPYPENRAAASLGGSVSNGVIVLNNGFYTRIK